MLQISEISNDHLIRALRIYVEDLQSKHSPFNKTPEYLRDLAGWIACAATRIDSLVPKDVSNKQSNEVSNYPLYEPNNMKNNEGKTTIRPMPNEPTQNPVPYCGNCREVYSLCNCEKPLRCTE